MKHSTRPSFNLRRSTVSLAVAAALSLAAQGAFAQSVVVTASNPTVDLGGATGASFGPDTSTVIDSVTNSGTDQATGTNDGVDNAATVTNWDNPVGAAIAGGTTGGAGIVNTGTIVALTNEGSINGTYGVDNKGTIQSLINALGATLGSGTIGLYGVYNETGATIGLLQDNGGLLVSMMNGVAYVNNAGHIVTLDEEGNETGTATSMQAAFLNAATGRIDTFTIGTNARITLYTAADGLNNQGTVTAVRIAGSLNVGGDALVNGSTTNTTASVGSVDIAGTLASQSGTANGNGIHNFGVMGDTTVEATGTLNGSTPGTAAFNNEATGVAGNFTLLGHSGSEGAVVSNKGAMGNVEIGAQAQATASGDAVIDNDVGASMGTLTTDKGASVSTLGSGNTNAVVENDGTMTAMALNGSMGAQNGVAVVNSQSGTVTNGITVGGDVSGLSGIENDGDLPTLDVVAGGTVTGTSIAGVELNNGTTGMSVSGVVAGSGPADAVQVTNPGTVANIVVENIGLVMGEGNGNGFTVGGGATANVTVQDNGTVEANGGAAVDAKNNGTVNLTLTGRNAQVVNAGSGSAIVGEQGSNLNVTTTGFSAGGAGPVITASASAPTIDIAGNATLNLDALVSNTNTTANAGAAIQIESSGNLTSFTNKGEVQGAVKNLSSNPLVIDGASSYTDGTAANGQLGLFSGFGSTATQSEIDSPNADVTVASGNVVLNDTVNAPNLNVASGASMISYSSVAVNGNLNVADGATLVSQVQSATSYGQWNVSGNTTLAGSTTLKLTPFTTFGFADGQRYTIIQTVGTASYNLAGITPSATGYTGTVTAEQVGNNLVVVLSAPSTGTGTGTGSGDTGTGTGTGSTNPTNPSGPTGPTTPPASHRVYALTQTSVASTDAIVRYTGWNSAGLMNAENTVLAIQQNGTARQLTQAGTQLAPVPHAQAGNAMLAIGDAAQGVVTDRAEALRAAKQAGAATPQGAQVWGQAFGGAEQRGATAGGTFGEVSGSNLTFGGLAVGVDTAIGTTDWRVGGAFSYTNGQSNATGDASGQSLGVNAFGFTLYQNWTPASGRVYVNVAENASIDQFNESRSINLAGVSAGSASGHFSGTSYGARVEAGLPLTVRGGFDVTPYVALGVQHLNLGSYTETDGGSGVGLSVNGASYTSVRSTLGVKLSKSFETKVGTVVPYAKLAYVHEFAGTPSNTTAVFNGDSTGETAFTTVSATPVRNIADLAVGATLYRAKGLSLNAQVNVQAGSHYTGVAGGVQAKWSF